MFNFGKDRNIRKFVRRVERAPNQKAKYGTIIDEYKRGKLYASSGQQVRKLSQARAIAYRMSTGSRYKSKSASKKSFLSKLKSIIGL